jgi:hypothetical protein
MAEKNMQRAVKFAVLQALILLAAALLSPPAHADGLKAGLWRVINKPEVNGQAAPPRENMRCLTAEDVKDLDKIFSPVSRTTNSTCERAEHESTPQRLKWRLKCTGQLDMDVAGEFVFDTPEHYSATINTEAAMLGQVMQKTRVTIEATRFGECQ